MADAAGLASTGARPVTVGDTHREIANVRRIGWPMLGVVGLGGLAQYMPIWGLTHLLLFYLTVLCGMPGSAAGLILAIALVADAVVDPLWGSLSDNSHSRHGRRHPFMIAAVLPMAIAPALLFSAPSGLNGAPLFFYALALLMIARVGDSAFNVPYIAMGAELSDDYHERSLVAASRLFFSHIAMALATFLAYGVFLKGTDGLTHREGYVWYAWTCAAIVVVSAGITIAGTLKARSALNAPTAGQRFAVGRFFAEVIELFRNPSFRTLFITVVVFMAAWGMISGLSLHANTFFWKLKTPQLLLVNLVGVGGAIVGIVGTTALRRVMQKRSMAIFGVGLLAICQLSLVPLRLAGIIPQDAAAAAVAISTALSYAGMAIALVAFQSMMADAADQHEELFGARREGLLYSGSTLATKASSGIGVMFAGIALDLIGFPHGLAHAAHAVIPPAVLSRLGIAYGPAAGMLALLAVVVLLGYRLGREEHAAIQATLARRKGMTP